MYLEKYQNLYSFEEQYEYLTNFTQDNSLNTLKFHKEIIKNANTFIKNTKIDSEKDFKIFYNFLIHKTKFEKLLENGIYQILDTKKENIHSETLYNILAIINQETIKDNSKIQEEIINYVSNKYDDYSFEIINEFIPRKKQKDLICNLLVEGNKKLIDKKDDNFKGC